MKINKLILTTAIYICALVPCVHANANFSLQRQQEALMLKSPPNTPWGKGIYKMPNYWLEDKHKTYFSLENYYGKKIAEYYFGPIGTKMRALIVAIEESKYKENEKNSLIIDAYKVMFSENDVDNLASKFLPAYEDKLKYIKWHEKKSDDINNPALFLEKKSYAPYIILSAAAKIALSEIWEEITNNLNNANIPEAQKIKLLKQLQIIRLQIDDRKWEELTNSDFSLLNTAYSSGSDIADKILAFNTLIGDFENELNKIEYVEVQPNTDLKKVRILRMYYQQVGLKRQLSKANSMIARGNRLKNTRDHTVGVGTAFVHTQDNSSAREEGHRLHAEGTQIIEEYKEVSAIITKLAEEILETNQPITLRSKKGQTLECVVLEVVGNKAIILNAKNSKIYTLDINKSLDKKSKELLK